MVCSRCVMVVKQIFDDVGVNVSSVNLGEVVVNHPPDNSQLELLDRKLNEFGFERIDDRKSRVIEAVKNKIISMIHHADRVNTKYNWSSILAEELHYDYNYLSNLFSSVEGITIEHYIIKQKIERAKELLFYDELTLGEIADRLGYSSIAHLSSQFKKITGLTPSALKKSRATQNRKSLDKI